MVSFNNRSRRGERRSPQKDLLLQLLTLFGVVSGVIVVTALLLLTIASPSSVSRVNAFNLSYFWDPRLLRYLFYVLITGFLVSSVGLSINFKRLKRKYDSVRVNLVFLWIISVVGIIAYLVTG